MRNALGRALQCEYPPHGPPPATAHADHDRRFQVTEQWAKVFVGASVDPGRTNRSIHWALFDAENGVGQKHRRVAVEFPRLDHTEPRLSQQLSQIVVGLVVRIVAAAVAHVVADIAEILADSEQFGSLVAEPRFPMTDDVGVEVEFGAAPDLPWAAFDANPTSLPCRYERAVLIQLTSLLD